MNEPAFLHPFASPAREQFVRIVRGEGARVWDDQGNEYVDGMASLWYCNVGYGRREVVDAVAAQLGTLHAYSCFDPFATPPPEELAERIAPLAPVDDPRVFFACSGSEAVDSAIKLSRIAHERAGAPGRKVVVSRSQGYHGVSYGGTSAQGIPPNQEGFGPLVPGFVNLHHHDLESMASLFAEQGDQIGAVLAEPVQGAGGVHPPEAGYLHGLRRLCDDHGAHLIFDEVICAFGRMGQWFGADHYGVRPDMITFAKGVTSGYMPLSGVVVGEAVRRPLEDDPGWVLRHGFTYSGHAAACAAAHKCIDITAEEGLLERAVHIGKRLADGLASLVDDGILAGCRGEVAVWAAQLHEDRQPPAVRDRMLELGVITRPLPPDALAFCPPLVATEAEVDRIVDALAEALR